MALLSIIVPVYNAATLVYVPQPLYRYRVNRSDSITNVRYNPDLEESLSLVYAENKRIAAKLRCVPLVRHYWQFRVIRRMLSAAVLRR